MSWFKLWSTEGNESNIVTNDQLKEFKQTFDNLKERTETIEYKIRNIESFLDKITFEIDQRLKRLENELSFFKEIKKDIAKSKKEPSKPKNKVGRPRKDKK